MTSRASSFLAATSIFTVLSLAAAARGQALEQQYVTPTSGSTTEYFGQSVATQGDRMVVGCPNDDAAAHDGGSVHVWRFDPTIGDWVFAQQLFASDAQYGANFGWSVALDGDLIVVSALGQSTSLGAYSGQAYVFRYDATSKSWKEEQKLLPSIGKTNDEFGKSVAVRGDRILIGASSSDTPAGNDSGCAFVYRYQDPTTKWVEEARLIDANAAMDDHAGRAVALDGVTAVVSRSLADAGALDQGAVSIFTRSGTNWSQTDELQITPTHSFTDFGECVAIQGDTIVAGAPGQDQGTTVADVGWIHVFEFNGSAWLETVALMNPNPAASSYFGKSGVALAGNLLVVGHPDDDANGKADAGSAWVYRHGQQSGWVYDGHLEASDGQAFDRFGQSVAASSEHILCGAPKHDSKVAFDWGVVYGYAAAPITLTIDPPNPAPAQAITFAAFRGAPGSPVMLTIEDVSGTPVFLPLFVAAFGSDEAFTFTANAPNPAYGLHVGMRAWKINSTGTLAHSALAYVDL